MPSLTFVHFTQLICIVHLKLSIKLGYDQGHDKIIFFSVFCAPQGLGHLTFSSLFRIFCVSFTFSPITSRIFPFVSCVREGSIVSGKVQWCWLLLSILKWQIMVQESIGFFIFHPEILPNCYFSVHRPTLFRTSYIRAWHSNKGCLRKFSDWRWLRSYERFLENSNTKKGHQLATVGQSYIVTLYNSKGFFQQRFILCRWSNTRPSPGTCIIKVCRLRRKTFLFLFCFLLRFPTLVGNLSVFVLSFLIKVSDFSRKPFCFRFVFSYY